MEKKSKFNWTGPWGQLTTALVGSVAAATLGAFADEIIDWLKENNLQSKSKDYYKKMLEAHPELKKEDPKLLAKYWSSLYHFAPYMAQDPLAAGAYIRQTMKALPYQEFGGPSVDTYSTLAGINKAVADTKERKTRGVGTEIGVGVASKVLADVVSQNIAPAKTKYEAASSRALKDFRKKYEEDRKKDLKLTREIANKTKWAGDYKSDQRRKKNQLRWGKSDTL